MHSPDSSPAPPDAVAAAEPSIALSPAPAEALTAFATEAEAASPAPAPQPPQRPRGWAKGLFGSVQSLLMTVVIAVFVVTFLVQAFQIPSESMENTLLIGDYLLVDKVHFARGGVWGEVLPYAHLQRGDVVVFRYPVDPRQHFVKRVVGRPGDRVRLHNKQVYVNGQPIEEDYVIYRSEEPDRWRDEFPQLDVFNPNVESNWFGQLHALVRGGELVVPPGQYFVLGDNRDESLDSRYWGLVPRENIIGRPLVIYWSLRHPGRIGLLAASDRPGDKLTYFAYALRHFFNARWRRTLRLVN